MNAAADFRPDGEVLRRQVQAALDASHRELIAVRCALIGMIYIGLGAFNFFAFEPALGLSLGIMAIITGLALIALAIYHSLVSYRDSLADVFLLLELAILQADGMAFLVLTDNIMNSYGVFVMILGAGIFASQRRWLVTAIIGVVVSWLATVVLDGIELSVTREILLMVSAIVAAGFFYFLRYRTTQRLVAAQMIQANYQQRLEAALAEIDTLSGLLPICASCKSIRDEVGDWHQVESYVRDHSDAEFTHSMCPDCIQKHHPELGRLTPAPVR